MHVVNMLCCCGLFLITVVDNEKIKIQYRPYRYRKKLLDDHKETEDRAIRVIQASIRKQNSRKDKKKIENSLIELESSVMKIGGTIA